MAIPYKLFMRLMDMETNLRRDPLNPDLTSRICGFMDEIGWPFKASQLQIKDWNAIRESTPKEVEESRQRHAQDYTTHCFSDAQG